MRMLHDLSGVLRTAYGLSHAGEYGRAREVLKDAIAALGPAATADTNLDLDILETCLDWVEASATAFYGDRPVPPSRVRMQA